MIGRVLDVLLRRRQGDEDDERSTKAKHLRDLAVEVRQTSTAIARIRSESLLSEQRFRR